MGGRKSFQSNRPKNKSGLQEQVDRLSKNTAEDPVKLAIKRLYNSLFNEQRLVVDDPSHYIVACCSRRAGKTEMVARWLLMTALQNPGTEILYITQSAKSARELMWANPKTGLPSLIKALELEEFTDLNETKTTIKCSNGSLIYISGAETKVDAAKWLGHAFKLVCVDEAQNLTDEVINYLVRSVILPTLKDSNGTILLAGTPKDSCSGIFYEASAGATTAWSRHKWTLWNNPYMPTARVTVKEELEKFCEKMDDPGPQRRYFGEWVHEDRVQLYQYMPGRNDYIKFPTYDDKGKIIVWSYICGLDIGFRDKTTFTIIAWSRQSPNAYILESYGRSEILDEELNKILKNYREKYKNLRVIADMGALGLRAMKNYMEVYNEYIEKAEKTDKPATIRLMNTFFRKGQIKIDPTTCQDLINELQRIEIDPQTQIERKQDRCDHADSALYAFKLTHSYLFKPKPIPLSVEEEWKVKARESFDKALIEVNKTEDEKLQEETEAYWNQQDRLFGNFF